MKRQPANRSALLLMEIIIAILFFSIVSAICLQIFVKSHNLSRSTEILDDAVTQTSSVGEIIRSSHEPVKSLQDIYPKAVKKGEDIYLYYDKNFTSCGKSKASFYIKVSINNARADFFKISAYNSSSKEELYSLEVNTYQQKKV